MPQVSKGCLNVFVGAMALLMLLIFIMSVLDFRAHGVQDIHCGARGCRTTLWPMVMSGFLGSVLLLVLVVSMTRRK